MKWKLLDLEDLDQVMRLQSLCHPQHYWESQASFAQKIQLPENVCGALWEGEQMVAYGLSYGVPVGVWPDLALAAGDGLSVVRVESESPRDWFLHDIVVHPGFRKRGLAEGVLVQLIQLAREWNPVHLRGIAVNGSAGHWQKYGMRILERDLPASYGPEAVGLVCEMQTCIDFFEAKALQSFK